MYHTPDFTRSAKVYLGLIAADLKLGRYESAFELMRRAMQAAALVGRGVNGGDDAAQVGRIPRGRRSLPGVWDGEDALRGD